MKRLKRFLSSIILLTLLTTTVYASIDTSEHSEKIEVDRNKIHIIYITYSSDFKSIMCSDFTLKSIDITVDISEMRDNQENLEVFLSEKLSKISDKYMWSDCLIVIFKDDIQTVHLFFRYIE